MANTVRKIFENEIAKKKYFVPFDRSQLSKIEKAFTKKYLEELVIKLLKERSNDFQNGLLVFENRFYKYIQPYHFTDKMKDLLASTENHIHKSSYVLLKILMNKKEDCYEKFVIINDTDLYSENTFDFTSIIIDCRENFKIKKFSYDSIPVSYIENIRKLPYFLNCKTRNSIITIDDKSANIHDKTLLYNDISWDKYYAVYYNDLTEIGKEYIHRCFFDKLNTQNTILNCIKKNKKWESIFTDKKINDCFKILTLYNYLIKFNSTIIPGVLKKFNINNVDDSVNFQKKILEICLFINSLKPNKKDYYRLLFKVNTVDEKLKKPILDWYNKTNDMAELIDWRPSVIIFKKSNKNFFSVKENQIHYYSETDINPEKIPFDKLSNKFFEYRVNYNQFYKIFITKILQNKSRFILYCLLVNVKFNRLMKRNKEKFNLILKKFYFSRFIENSKAKSFNSKFKIYYKKEFFQELVNFKNKSLKIKSLIYYKNLSLISQFFNSILCITDNKKIIYGQIIKFEKKLFKNLLQNNFHKWYQINMLHKKLNLIRQNNNMTILKKKFKIWKIMKKKYINHKIKRDSINTIKCFCVSKISNNRFIHKYNKLKMKRIRSFKTFIYRLKTMPIRDQFNKYLASQALISRIKTMKARKLYINQVSNLYIQQQYQEPYFEQPELYFMSDGYNVFVYQNGFLIDSYPCLPIYNCDCYGNPIYKNYIPNSPINIMN